MGFDAYRKAIDCLRPGDVAMLTGYAGFRPLQLEYAVEKGVNVFMEKSFAPDPPGVRRIIKAGEAAEKKNLKIAAGLHVPPFDEPAGTRSSGSATAQLGDIQLIRAYRMQPCGGLAKRRRTQKELHLADPQLHPFPLGLGRTVRRDEHPPDRRDLLDQGRLAGLGARRRRPDRRQHAIAARTSTPSPSSGPLPTAPRPTDVVRWTPELPHRFRHVHSRDQVRGPDSSGRCAMRDETLIYKDQRTSPGQRRLEGRRRRITPWQAEWNVLLDAIRNDRPHNEAKRAALSNLADLMGRAAVHSGKVITWDEAMASNFQFCPNIDALTADSPAPVQADAQGRYPVPIPGVWSEI